jgi:hypothetical protein
MRGRQQCLTVGGDSLGEGKDHESIGFLLRINLLDGEHSYSD